jgi:diguanylate cyclase (GGDEF)-like protein/PAS domain S-box-containing protein
MQQLTGQVLSLVIDGAPEGLAVCDAQAADMPVVYVNPAFERLTGYGAMELLGRNLRLLQGTDNEQDGSRRLHEAVSRGEGCRVTLRNYRKDGTSFWNEVQLQPLRDAGGVLTHYVAYYRDAGGRLKSPERPLEGIPTWLREDRVSGLSSRVWFEELMQRDWATARREQRSITLLLFDIDGLALYCDTFGKAAGDAAIRRIARQISASFRRGADVVGRWDNGCAAVLAGPVVPVGINDYAQLVAQRVLELHIHNPRATNQKMLTVSTGVATTVPAREEDDCGRLVRAAESALRHAQAVGGGRVAVATEEDFSLPA